MLANRSILVRQPKATSVMRSTAVAPRPVLQVRSMNQLLELAAGAPGSVDAPEWILPTAAIVITIAVTALVPIYLKGGQEAADQIFDAEKKTNGKPTERRK
eukprot:gene15293-21377_t